MEFQTHLKRTRGEEAAIPFPSDLNISIRAHPRASKERKKHLRSQTLI
jgi:hypothetical protein